MTRLDTIRARLPKMVAPLGFYARQDVAWLVETVDLLAAGLRVARHTKKKNQRRHERSCLECSALARLEAPDAR